MPQSQVSGPSQPALIRPCPECGKVMLLERIEPEKAGRAVQLSMEKYCSVVKTLEGAGAKISWGVMLNGNKI